MAKDGNLDLMGANPRYKELVLRQWNRNGVIVGKDGNRVDYMY